MINMITPYFSSNRISIRTRLWLSVQNWPWGSRLTLIASCSMLLLACAYHGAQSGAGWAEPLFWASLLLLFVPIAARLFSKEISEQERIQLLIVVGLGFYLVKMLSYPLNFTFFDESIHWKGALDVIKSGRLFQENSLLPVAPFFPGLILLTTGLMSLTGLDIFAAGAILLAVARVIFVLALYLFYKEASDSPRVASIATLLYMTQPNFVFFNAQLAYESLALPLATFILFLLTRRLRSNNRVAQALTFALLLAIGTVIITHHVTSYVLLGYLFLWATVTLYIRSQQKDNTEGTDTIVLLAFVTVIAWMIHVATMTIGYLAPNLTGGLLELGRIIAGELSSRELFRSSTGDLPPLWQRLTGIASVLMIILVFPFGLRQTWQRYRHKITGLALLIAALGYPASLAIRFTTHGAELSNRASAFLFVAVTFMLAVAIEKEPILNSFNRSKSTTAFCVWIGIIFVGSIIVGNAPWARMPGPYLVGADMRSVNQQGIRAAQWSKSVLGTDNRIATDRTNRMLLGTYGEQHAITGFGDRIPIANVFVSREMGEIEREILQYGQVRYLLLDDRLTTELPTIGFYFELGEPGTYEYKTPLDPVCLAKFKQLDEVNRLFDSGDISIYDIGALTNAP